MIYLDNAATSWPKPEAVYNAVDSALRECGGNSGRGSHSRSVSAGEKIYEARMMCSELFHASKPECVCFTSNTTEALNMAIKGVLRSGDHVLTSSMEHNSVSRPLKKLESLNILTTKVLTHPQSGIDLDALESAFQSNTKLVVCNHISNVTGTINPIGEIGKLCKKKGALFLLDAAQSAGLIPIDVQNSDIDLLAFPGHKGLLGPQGTGGLYIREDLQLDTLKEGGTGTQSELYDQPFSKPERYESGTLNLPGIAGLAAGVKYIMDYGITTIAEEEARLTNRLIDGLRTIKGIKIFGPDVGVPRGSIVSINFEAIAPSDAAIILDNVFSIAVRAGLHCARDAHETLGTINQGGVLRISPNWFNTVHEMDLTIEAVKSIIQEMN